MREIPQRGWFIAKEGDEPTTNNTKVYLDGKMVEGIQTVSVELSAEMLPVIKLVLYPVGGLTVDAAFGPPCYHPAPKDMVFRSAQRPEDVLKSLEAKEKEAEAPKTEIL